MVIVIVLSAVLCEPQWPSMRQWVILSLTRIAREILINKNKKSHL